MRLYRVTYQFETVIAAEGRHNAEDVAREYAEAALGDALRVNDLVVTTSYVTAMDNLATNWTIRDIPWNEPNDKTVGEYLCT